MKIEAVIDQARVAAVALVAAAIGGQPSQGGALFSFLIYMRRVQEKFVDCCACALRRTPIHGWSWGGASPVVGATTATRATDSLVRRCGR